MTKIIVTLKMNHVFLCRKPEEWRIETGEAIGFLKKIRGKDKNCKKNEGTLSDIVPLVKGEKKNNNKQSFWFYT